MMLAPSTHNVAPLLRVEGLTKRFRVKSGGARGASRELIAIDRVTLEVKPGEVLGLVGESGCGKSTLCRIILRLIEPSAGSIVFDGHDLLRMPKAQLRAVRKDLQIIFQDPFSSLDPRMTVDQIVGEPLRVHQPGRRREHHARIQELLALVGLQPHHAALRPHEFSGGQRQRIAIARALALNPRLVICDEPVSALDVSVQAQIVNLLAQLRSSLGLAYIFVSHDLRVVRHISDRTAVMYLGRVVELADKSSLFSTALHPYTQALLRSVLSVKPRADNSIEVIPGEIPSALNPPSGCRFHTRCPFRQDICREVEPKLVEVRPDHHVACHFAAEVSLRQELPAINCIGGDPC
jgi:peptide/nickel transport system ATP-binding protein